MTWDDVIKLRDNIPDTEIYEKLILYLYTYFPPRRVKDYHQIYYSNRTSKKMMKEDKGKNYITSDSKFIYNTYKTAKLYKQNTFDCPIEIYQLINRMGYKDGDKLFPNTKLPSDFSAFVIKIFTNNTYKHVTAADLRSIYLTDYYNSGQKTEEDYNRIADMMAHSRKQQGQYRNIIKDDNPDSSVFLVPSSVPSVISSSTVPSVPSSVSSTVSSTVSSLVSSFPSIFSIPDDQFKEFMGKLCKSMYENMYKHMYNQLYNDIKSEVLASFPKTESTKKNKN